MDAAQADRIRQVLMDPEECERRLLDGMWCKGLEATGCAEGSVESGEPEVERRRRFDGHCWHAEILRLSSLTDEFMRMFQLDDVTTSLAQDRLAWGQDASMGRHRWLKGWSVGEL